MRSEEILRLYRDPIDCNVHKPEQVMVVLLAAILDELETRK